MPDERPRSGAPWTEHTVTAAQAGQTVQEILVGPMGVSRRMIQRLTRSKGLRHRGRPAWLNTRVREGDVVAARLVGNEEPGLAPVRMPLEIVMEDADLLVANKPPGVLVHPTGPGQNETLAHGVAWHLERQGVLARVHPVHRIDRDTSGLVLFARTAHAHHRLDVQLRAGELRREYLALVDGVVGNEAGVVDAPIARDPRNPVLRAIRAGGERAVTRYQVQERYAAATLLRLELETGRTHQVRVHMRHAGHPVLGDRQYGRRGLGIMARQALHASCLAFAHPSTGEPVTVQAAVPPDMQNAVAALRLGAAG